MPLVLKDRVRVTTTTTGTGTYTLGAAATGFQSFTAIGNGNTTYYAVTDGTNWEVGVGTFSTTGPTLARTEILESSNANAAVNWGAGSKDVFVTLPAEKAIAPTTLVVKDRSDIAVNVALANGFLPVTNRAGTIVYVAAS